MAPLETSNLHRMETLLFQSAQGIHLLFDNDSIAQVLSKYDGEDDFMNNQNLDRIQHILTELMDRKTLGEKRRYINSLDKETYELLMRTYFHIVDNAVLASTELKH